MLFFLGAGHHPTLHQFVVVGGGRGDTVWQEGLPIYRTKILWDGLDLTTVLREVFFCAGSEEAVLTGVGSTIEIYITSREHEVVQDSGSG